MNEAEQTKRDAEWRAMVAESLKPDTAESVQESAIAENQSMQIPRER